MRKVIFKWICIGFINRNIKNLLLQGTCRIKCEMIILVFLLFFIQGALNELLKTFDNGVNKFFL